MFLFKKQKNHLYSSYLIYIYPSVNYTKIILKLIMINLLSKD